MNNKHKERCRRSLASNGTNRCAARRWTMKTNKKDSRRRWRRIQNYQAVTSHHLRRKSRPLNLFLCLLLWEVKWCNMYKRIYKGGKEHRVKNGKKKDSIPTVESPHNSWVESMLLDPVAGQFALRFSINSWPETKFPSPFHQSPHTFFILRSQNVYSQPFSYTFFRWAQGKINTVALRLFVP